MLTLHLDNITIFLQNSDLYNTLKELSEKNNELLDNKTFEIPNEYYEQEIIIITFEDLIRYIRIFNYWMINKIPNEFYKWIFENKNMINMNLLNEYFIEDDLINEIQLLINSNAYDLCKNAAEKGFLRILIFGRESGYKWNTFIPITTIAAENGHLNILKYAHENGFPSDKSTCSIASKNGHLDCLKYAHENGCSWDEQTCINAAANGYLDILKYAHENGCAWDIYTCINAAAGGYLDILKYAYENGCPWDKYICINAATRGHLDCLKYAHENGCPWDKFTCYYASENGHLDILKYAEENGCPYL
jgi:hypothetical protein